MADKYIPSFDDTEEVSADYVPSFDDTEEIEAASEQLKDINPNDEEAPSKADAILQGASRGITMGFSDEIAGAFEAGGQALGIKGLGGPVTDLELQSPTWDKEQLLEAYRSGKKAQRGRELEAQEEHPVTFTGSEIGGAFATPIPGAALAKTGKVGTTLAKALPSLKGSEKITKAAKLAEKAKKLEKFEKYMKLKNAARAKSLAFATREGVKAGTIAGIAESEADLTSGDIEDTKQLMKDAAKGGTIGGLFSAGLVKGAHWGEDLLKAVPGVQQALDSFSFGLKGIKLDEDLTSEKIGKASKKYLGELNNKLNGLGKNKQKILEMIDDAGIRLNTKDDLAEAKNLVKNIESAEVKKDAQKFLDILDDYIGDGKATKNAITKLEKELVKSGLKDPSQEAKNALQKKALEDAIRKNKMPSDAVEGVVSDVPGIDEGVEAVYRQTVKGIDEATGEPILKQTAKAYTKPNFTGIKRTVDPGSGREVLSISDEVSGKIKSVVTDIPSAFDAEQLTSEQANTLVKRLKDYSSVANNERLPDEVKKAATQAIVKIKEKLSGAAKEIKQPLDEINKKISKAIDVKTGLGIKDKFKGLSPEATNEKNAQILAKFISGVGDNNPISDKSILMRQLKKVDPELARQMNDEVTELRRLYQLSPPKDKATESANLISLLGSAHNMINKAANAVGRGVGSAQKPVKYLGQKAKPVTDKYKRAILSNQSLDIIDSSPDKLTSIVSRIEQSGDSGTQRFLNPLRKALETDVPSRRNAIMWGLAQQPAFRELFNLYTQTNEENIGE